MEEKPKKKRKPRKPNTPIILEQWATEENLTRLKHWYREGLTDAEVAKNKLGICRTTFYKWLKECPEMRQAVNEGKAPVDDMVEDALLKRALGYEATEGRINEDGSKVMIKKHIPSDTTALIFWLKNRRRDRWRDKWEMEVTGELPVVIKDDIQE